MSTIRGVANDIYINPHGTSKVNHMEPAAVKKVLLWTKVMDCHSLAPLLLGKDEILTRYSDIAKFVAEVFLLKTYF